MAKPLFAFEELREDLSDEEISAIDNDVVQKAAELETSGSELDQLDEVSSDATDAVQELTDIHATIASPNVSQEALAIAAIANQAIRRRLGYPSQTLGLESAATTADKQAIAVEGISDLVSDITGKMKALLAKAQKKLKEYYSKLKEYGNSVRARLGSMKERSKGLKPNPEVEDKTISLEGLFDAFKAKSPFETKEGHAMVNDLAFNNELTPQVAYNTLRALDHVSNSTATFFKAFVADISNFEKTYTDVVAAVESGAVKSLEEVRKTYFVKKVPEMTNLIKKLDKGFADDKDNGFFGRVTVDYFSKTNRYILAPTEETLIKDGRLLRSGSMKPTGTTGKVEIKICTIKALDDLCDEGLGVLDKIDAHVDQWNKLSKDAYAVFDKLVEHLVNKAEKSNIPLMKQILGDLDGYLACIQLIVGKFTREILVESYRRADLVGSYVNACSKMI